MQTTTNAQETQALFRDRFAQLEQVLGARANGHIHQLRRAALADFEQLGLPTTKDEEWRYTNMASRLKGRYDFGLITSAAPAGLHDLKTQLFQGLEANIMVFINGVYSPYSSTILSPIHQLELLSLDRAEEKRAEPLFQHFAQHAPHPDGFAALNTAFAEQGVYLYVPEGQTLELPVVIVHLIDTRHGAIFSQPRNLIVLGKGASLKVVETFATTGEGANFTNAVTEIVVHEDAHLELYKLQDGNELSSSVDTTHIYQQSRSRTTALTVTHNSDMVRNNLNVVLDGEECEANMYGLYLGKGKLHVDNHTSVRHVQPNSQSNELYKGILDGRSTGVFNGKIFVEQIAQKTNAFQSNRNILLSDDASVNTKPQLEIFADDVRCTHGATIGALDEEPLFYLRSRGIGEDLARRMLLKAFADEVLDNITIPEVRQNLENWLEA